MTPPVGLFGSLRKPDLRIAFAYAPVFTPAFTPRTCSEELFVDSFMDSARSGDQWHDGDETDWKALELPLDDGQVLILDADDPFPADE